MKRPTYLVATLVLNVVFLSGSAFAQTPAPNATQAPASSADGTDFQTGEINLMGLGRNDVDSSKFEEYRDVVKGISLPYFRLFGRDKGVRFDLRGQNVKQHDERYTGYLKTDLFGISADYNSIIHRIGNDGRTMLILQSPGIWKMSPTLQQSFQDTWESTTNANRVFTTFVAPLFTPSIDNGSTVDVQVLRERTDITIDLTPNRPFSTKVNYRREQRHGSGGLSSNYISYEIETPSVTEYLTQDVGVSGVLDKPWGDVRAAIHYNWFDDQVPALEFDNPFRATDALSVTNGSGAAATGVGGPNSGLMVNPPDNSAVLGAVGTTLKLRDHTRITADLNLGNLSQNDQFFPYLTNTAVVTPVLASQTSSLPVQSLNGKIRNTSVVLAATSRPTEPLHLSVRYRVYDLNNQTPRITFPGYGSWDRTWSDGARINVPYGYTNSRLDATADFDITQILTLEGGYRLNTIDRTFRETERTTENAGSITAIMHVAGNMANLRASYEKGSRGFSGLDLGRSEDASFVTPPSGLSANALARDGSLRFDQANRDSDRAGLIFDISPVRLTSLAFTYFHNKDKYNDTAYGLQNASYDTYTGEVSVSPGDQWNVSGYYSHEKNGSAQINNGTSNFPMIDDFTTRLNDVADTLGSGAMFQLPQKATLNLGAKYQNLKGTAGFTTNPGSTYQLARASLGGVKDIPNADNVKIVRLDASVDYAIRPKVTLTMGTWYEDYVFSDVDSVGLQNIYPGAFFLALNDGSYRATVGYVRLKYDW